MTQTEASYKHKFYHKECGLTLLLFVKFAENIFTQMKNLNHHIRRIHGDLRLSLILNVNIP